MSPWFMHVALAIPWMLAFLGHVSADSTTLTLAGGGAPIPMPLYLSTIFSYRFVQPSVHVTFSGTVLADQAVCMLSNSSTYCIPGDTSPQPWYLDWGSIVTLPSADTYRKYSDLQLYPTCASSVVPIYNLNGITSLVLTMQILAKIWSGRITTWDHPDIQATNPSFAAWNIPANQSITLVARADSAGSTQLFKKSLAAIDPVFKAQIGTAGAAVWNGTKVTLLSTPQIVIAYVMRNAYAMGFAPPGDALGSKIPMAKLNRSGIVVEPSTTSVQYALLERGLSFGNNGDSADHLTADLFNSVNPLAWPIVSYAYLLVRKSTLRPNATCANVAAMVNFWVWFWNSDEVATLATSLGFSVLPEVVRDFVVTRFKSDIQCSGSAVWQEPEVPIVAGYGLESALSIFEKFQQAYALVNSSVVLNYTTLASDRVDVAPLLQAGGFLVSTAPPTSSSVYSLVLGREAVVGISVAALTLNGVTLAKILNGDIKTWLHADILALNPNGIRFSGKTLNDTAQRIVLLQGPTASSAALTSLMQQYYPVYTGAAIQAAEKCTQEELLWTAVLGTPYSFSVTALVGQMLTDLQMASIVSDVSTKAVTPSLATAAACTSSSSSCCYPLLLNLYVSLQRQCPQSSATARAVTFLQWMFTEDTLEAALNALNIVSLTTGSSTIQAANAEALFQLSCQVRAVPATTTDIVPLLLAIIIPIATVVLIGVALCGWWLWRVTESNRALRKKFSNDNVAESCAEAIARFDLAAVEWLREVKEPNKIQQSFLAIISLLTEVKPYIPDQLLSRLTANKAVECQGVEDKEAEPLSPVSSASSRLQPRPSCASRSNMCQLPGAERVNNRSTISSSEGTKQVLAMRDWRRKRCTYMCARFGSAYHHQERRLLTLAQVVGQIVDVAKANGATIDAVGVDAVNVHWGVTAASGASATRAVQASLEIAKLRETLPEDQQATFWLQIGIGKGVCDCGTVSCASGNRFFVVWGSEASLALEVATTNQPKRVLASVLVSPAVYQEVQFTVQCMPRLWHGDSLLWEPRCVLRKEEDDEWMYELKKMNEDASLASKTLLDAFLLSRTASPAELSAHIAQLRSQHGGKMSSQDTASLDLLLAESVI